MKSFRTELTITPSPIRISHETPLITIGSCFAQSIGDQFSVNKFKVLPGVLGTLYSPDAIHHALMASVGEEMPAANTYIEQQDTWFNYHFHSTWHGRTKNELETSIGNAMTETRKFLQEARVLIITYGTAKTWHLKSDGLAVANCHKMPSTLFTSRLHSPQEIESSFTTLYQTLKRLNPDVQILLTVSPVRHTRDTLLVNAASKSSLRWACHCIQQGHKQVEYFPAYESLIDDLRDYRFYLPDMIHPSGEAIEYIWAKFQETYFEQQTIGLIRSWQQVKKSLSHRPFHEGTMGHRQFLEQLLRDLRILEPQLKVHSEIAFIQQQLKTPNP